MTSSPPGKTSIWRRGFSDTRKFRHEIHGVRGLAIAGVVLFHVFGQGRVSGGIDAFLAITGFLAIPSLVRMAENNRGWVNLAKRWANVAKRILIPLVPVLIFVAIVGSLIYPLPQIPQLWEQIQASALGYENWNLVANSMNYNAAGADVSPLQHLWSISVQLQFHVIVPFIVMAVVAPCLLLKKSPRAAMVVTLVVISAASMTYAIVTHETSQSMNYLSTWSRAWELCLAGAVALVIPRLRLTSTVRVVLAWIGIAMLFSTGFWLDGSAEFPSFPALWPVGGLLLILIAGETRSRFGPDRLWTLAPVVFIADIAYSLYLWHWPILIFWIASSGTNDLGFDYKALIIVISVAVAWLSYQVFEKRTASSGFFTAGKLAPWRTLATAGFAGALVATVAGMSIVKAEDAFEAELAAQLEQLERANAEAEREAGIAAFSEELSSNLLEDIVPSPELARGDGGDVFALEESDCYYWGGRSGPVTFCETLPDSEAPTVVFIGASHVNQWWGAAKEWAEEENINLALAGMGGCLLMDVEYDPQRFNTSAMEPNSSQKMCAEWNAEALPKLLDLDPDLVVTLGTRVREDKEWIEKASVAAWEALGANGIPVLAIRDTPYWTSSVDKENDAVACVLANPDDIAACTIPRVYDPSFDNDLPSFVPDNVTYFDVAPLVCPGEDTCPAVLDGYLLYRDGNHLTNTFVSSLREEFVAAVSRTGAL